LSAHSCCGLTIEFYTGQESPTQAKAPARGPRLLPGPRPPGASPDRLFSEHLRGTAFALDAIASGDLDEDDLARILDRADSLMLALQGARQGVRRPTRNRATSQPVCGYFALPTPRSLRDRRQLDLSPKSHPLPVPEHLDDEHLSRSREQVPDRLE
jgi:hypothetical protein